METILLSKTVNESYLCHIIYNLITFCIIPELILLYVVGLLLITNKVTGGKCEYTVK